MPLIFDTDPAPITITLDCDDAPEGERVRWTIRALPQAEFDALRESAGPRPVRGSRLLDEMRASADPAAFEDGLDDADRAAVETYLEWIDRLQRAVISAAVVAVEPAPPGWPPLALLDTVRPLALATRARAELFGHAARLVGLDPKARACYGWRCGSSGTASAEGGGATTAPVTPSC